MIGDVPCIMYSFIGFSQLHSVTVRDMPQSTHNLLSEHAEKLAAARALCNQHVKYVPNYLP